MSNICNNRLTVTGPAEDVARFVEKAKGPYQHFARPPHETAEEYAEHRARLEAGDDFSFHQLVPLPAEVIDGPYDPVGHAAERAAWGVKWGGCDGKLVSRTSLPTHHVNPIGDTQLIYTFQTPWGPPDVFLLRLARLWPVLHFALSFGEEFPTRGRFVLAGGRQLLELREASPPGDPYDETRAETDSAYEDAYAERHDAWRDCYLDTHDAWVSTGYQMLTPIDWRRL